MLGCAGIFGTMNYFEAYATCLSALEQSPCCASNRVYSSSTLCQWRTTTGPTRSACVTCSSSTSSAACPSCLTFITGSFAKVGDRGVLLAPALCVCVHGLTRPVFLLLPSVTQSPHFPPHFLAGDMTQEEAFKAAIATWPAGVRPVAHWSESQAGRPDFAHSDYVRGPFNMYGLERDVDLMIEAKCKELALLCARGDIPFPDPGPVPEEAPKSSKKQKQAAAFLED